MWLCGLRNVNGFNFSVKQLQFRPQAVAWTSQRMSWVRSNSNTTSENESSTTLCESELPSVSDSAVSLARRLKYSEKKISFGFDEVPTATASAKSVVPPQMHKGPEPAELPAPLQVLPPEKQEVRCKLVVWNISDLNLINGTFSAKFRLTAFWTPSHANLEAIQALTANKLRTSAKWELEGRERAVVNDIIREDVPAFALTHASSFEVGRSGVEVHAIEPEPNRVLLRWTCEYSAVFTQPSLITSEALQNFPYDSHVLEIGVSVRFGAFKHVPLKLAVNEDNLHKRGVPPHGNIEESMLLTEFFLPNYLDCQIRGGNKTPDDKFTGSFTFVAAIKLCRKYQYYETNIIQLNAAMLVMGLMVFVFEPQDFGSRSSHLLAVMFGSVGLRFVVDSLLPKLDYNTLAQDQLNASVHILVMMVLESGLLAYLIRLQIWPEKLARMYTNGADIVLSILITLFVFYKFLQLRAPRKAHKHNVLKQKKMVRHQGSADLSWDQLAPERSRCSSCCNPFSRIFVM